MRCRTDQLLWPGDSNCLRPEPDLRTAVVERRIFATMPHTSTQKVGARGYGFRRRRRHHQHYIHISERSCYRSLPRPGSEYSQCLGHQRAPDFADYIGAIHRSRRWRIIPASPPDGRVFSLWARRIARGIHRLLINDFEYNETSTLSGPQRSPMTLVGSSPGLGQYTLDPLTGQHTFSAADATKVMTITYVYSVPDSNSNGQPRPES